MSVTKYSGTPNEPEKDKSLWQKFLSIVFPYIQTKHRLAERLLEAKVAQEIAKADIMEYKAEQESLKVIQMAQKLEEQKGRKLTVMIEEPTREEFFEELKKIEGRIKELKLKYGTEIKFGQKEKKREQLNDIPESDYLKFPNSLHKSLNSGESNTELPPSLDNE